MILPLIAVYGLYVSINEYYQDKNVEEYFEKWNTVTDLKGILDDPTLYNRTNTFEEIEKLTSGSVNDYALQCKWSYTLQFQSINKFYKL